MLDDRTLTARNVQGGVVCYKFKKHEDSRFTKDKMRGNLYSYNLISFRRPLKIGMAQISLSWCMMSEIYCVVELYSGGLKPDHVC